MPKTLQRLESYNIRLEYNFFFSIFPYRKRISLGKSFTCSKTTTKHDITRLEEEALARDMGLEIETKKVKSLQKVERHGMAYEAHQGRTKRNCDSHVAYQYQGKVLYGTLQRFLVLEQASGEHLHHLAVIAPFKKGKPLPRSSSAMCHMQPVIIQR